MSEEANKLLSHASEIRALAEEILARAENFRDANARKTMHRIAESYTKLAERLEQAADSESK